VSQYFAAAVTHSAAGWIGREVDLHEVVDLDLVVDELRDLTEGPGPALLFVEEDDEYVGIVRVDDDSDPRCFISDARVTVGGEISAMLRDNVETVVPAAAEDDEAELEPVTARAGAVPTGDANLLADLGVPAAELLDLCARKGMLPTDVITAVAERIGCLDTMEELLGE
jgi:putative tRNA adenosine deaminase-associated protein